MPKQNLCDGDALHPLAPFKVLAVMCHPADRMAQRKMVALVESQSGVGPARRPRLTNDAFSKQVERAGYRGGVHAGSLLLNIIQLAGNRERPSFSRALALLLDALPAWEQPVAPLWSLQPPSTYRPRNRATVLRAFDTFLPASHLWASLIFAHQEGRQGEIGPASNESLPQFLAYAESFLSAASRIRWQGKDRHLVLPWDLAWRFKVPKDLKVIRPLHTLPLSAEQNRVLASRRGS